MKSVAKRTVTVILSVILAVMCFVSRKKEKREASAVIEDIITGNCIPKIITEDNRTCLRLTYSPL